MKTRFPNFIRYLSTIAATVLVISLTSCSSSSKIPSETNYYLLNNQQTTQTAVNISKTVAVKVLELPTYLHQPHLVMQLNKHQLHYARFDMWAEPLQVGFTKALLSDLNQNNNGIEYVTDEFQPDKQSATKVIVRVDYFHPSSASKVTLSGVFWRENIDKKIMERQAFSFELLLNEDGYTHAIAQMRQLVSMMSESILLMSD